MPQVQVKQCAQVASQEVRGNAVSTRPAKLSRLSFNTRNAQSRANLVSELTSNFYMSWHGLDHTID